MQMKNAKQIWIDFPCEFASNYIIHSACVFCFSLYEAHIRYSAYLSFHNSPLYLSLPWKLMAIKD